MTLTGATPVQYSRRGFAENRKYQATGNGPRSVRRVSIIRRPITVRPVPPAVRYARVREGGRRKTETIPGALPGRPPGRGLSRLDKVQKFGLQGARQKQKREAQPRAARSSWQKQRGRRIRIPECQKHSLPSESTPPAPPALHHPPPALMGKM